MESIIAPNLAHPLEPEYARYVEKLASEFNANFKYAQYQCVNISTVVNIDNITDSALRRLLPVRTQAVMVFSESFSLGTVLVFDKGLPGLSFSLNGEPNMPILINRILNAVNTSTILIYSAMFLVPDELKCPNVMAQLINNSTTSAIRSLVFDVKQAKNFKS